MNSGLKRNILIKDEIPKLLTDLKKLDRRLIIENLKGIIPVSLVIFVKQKLLL